MSPIDTSIYGNVRPPAFNSPFESLGQIMALRQQQDLRQQQIQSAQALEEERRQKLATAQQEQKNKTLLGDAYRQAFDANVGKVDRVKFRSLITQAGLGAGLADIEKGLDEAETAASKRRQEELNEVKTYAKIAVDSGFNPMVVDGLFAAAELSGLDVGPFRQMYTEQPDQFKTMFSNMVNPPKQAEPFSLGPGQTQFDASGKPIASVPPNPPVASFQSKDVLLDGQPSMVNFDSRTGKYFQGDQDVTARVRPVPPQAPKDDRIVQIMGPNGTPIWVKESEAVGKPAAQAARAVTGAERQALAFFNRAKEAVDTVTPLEAEIAKMSLAGQTQLEFAPNFMQTQLGQSYRQAQRAFTEARLRKESGAAIPTSEYANDAKTYFAQPGDKALTIEQKRKARATVLDGLGYAAGKAYDEFYGQSLKDSKALPPASQFTGQPPGQYRATSPDGKQITIEWDGQTVKASGF